MFHSKDFCFMKKNTATSAEISIPLAYLEHISKIILPYYPSIKHTYFTECIDLDLAFLMQLYSINRQTMSTGITSQVRSQKPCYAAITGRNKAT